MNKIFPTSNWAFFLLLVIFFVAVIMISKKINAASLKNSSDLIECEINKAMAKKYPEKIALVTSADNEGNPNIITMGWHMVCSGEPPMVAISVGKTRYSHRLISQTKEFVYTFPGEDLQKEMLFCGTHSGRNVNKFKETGLTQVKAKFVKPPLIGECIVNFECKVVGEYDAGDHTIFVGKILTAWISQKASHRKGLYSLGSGKYGGL